MAFDPKEYIKEEPAFDPKAYLAETKKPKGSAGQAALESYGNTALMGYLPHAQALAENVTPNPTRAVDEKLMKEGFTISQPEETYIGTRDANIKRQQELAAEFPRASAAGTVAGVIGGTLLTGAAGKAAGLVAPTNFAGRLKASAKAGAALGAITNPGDVEGQVGLQLEERGKAAGVGALMGVGSQAALEGGVKLAQGFAAGAKKIANEKAFKALGPYAREARQNYAKGTIGEVGRELLDTGVVSPRLTSYEGIAKRASQASETAGKKVGAVIDKLAVVEDGLNGGGAASTGLAIPGAKTASAGISRKAIADSLEEELISKGGLQGLEEGENSFFGALIKGFNKSGGASISLKDAQALKQELKAKIKWDRLPGADIPPKEQFYRALYRKVNQGIDDAAEALSQIAGGNAPQELSAAKKSYGALKEAEKISSSREAKEFANRFLSPTDYLSGGLGAAAGVATGDSPEEKLQNALIGGSLALVNKGARKYGNQVSAVGLDRLGSALAATPAVAQLAGKNPAAFQGLVTSINQQRQGGPSFTPSGDQYPILKDQKLMENFRKNPGLIDAILDDNLRAAVKREVGRSPSSDSAMSRRMNQK